MVLGRVVTIEDTLTLYMLLLQIFLSNLLSTKELPCLPLDQVKEDPLLVSQLDYFCFTILESH